MTARRIAFAGVLVLVGVIVWVLVPSGDEDPRVEIERVLETAVDAVAERDLQALMTVVSPRFTGRGMDRDQLQTYLYMQLRRGSWRRVFLVDTQIELGAGERPGTARVETRAVLASGEEIQKLSDLAGTDAGAYLLRLRFAREEDDAWRVLTASWERVDLPAL